MDIKKTDYVQSLDKGLKVLTAFSADRKSMTLSEVAEITGLTRAAARRFLLTYCYLGYMSTNGKYFELTSKVLDLGYRYMSSLDISELAGPLMKKLSLEVGESCSLATLDGLEVIYIARQQVSRIMTVSLGVGSRLPAHVTSMGRVLWAMNDLHLTNALDNIEYKQYTINSIMSKEHLKRELEKVKLQKWSLVDQELEAGLRSISAPIFSKGNKVKYAINILVQTSRFNNEELVSNVLPHLQATCEEISIALKKSS
ncbi:helix-turn-helix domain-containing protein [Maribacter sp. MMG018]|uniref:IclR family transcriptional regulator domain-containing protein n=1 Tax=Maribacter sp. MMG018 TaxID=2822688 RepID=UPI001B35C78E|nr:IclR family transcriptional regulator C-terminal domain-containing protein [Maribacter sp. MMG018]MBQ4913265.1 helix-turn-helix domain-containing protein [Maribacter sp. MMG018]